jgi:cysteinyl-tRNA synthetase
LELLFGFDRVLGLELETVKVTMGDEKINSLLKDRETARSSKNWKLSDEIRDEIKKLGFEVEDTASGQVLSSLRGTKQSLLHDSDCRVAETPRNDV